MPDEYPLIIYPPTRYALTVDYTPSGNTDDDDYAAWVAAAG